MRKVLYVLIFLILMSTVSAVQFDVDISPIKDRIYANETAEFNVKVKNLGESSSKFSIFSPNSITGDWVILTKPISDSSFILKSNEEKEVILTIRGIGKLKFGQHQIFLEVGGDDSIVKSKVNVILQNPEVNPPSYYPRVILTPEPEYSVKFEPSEQFPITLHLLNKNSLNIKDMRVRLSSSFFDTEKTTEIGPFESKTIKFIINSDPFVTPRKDNLNIKLIVNNEVVTLNEFPFEVIGRELEFTSKEVSSGVTRTAYRVTNPSNVEKSEEFVIPVSFIMRPFASAYEGAYYKKGQFVWDLKLKPNETVEVYVEHSLYKIIIIIGILFLLGFFYKKFKPDIILQQKVSAIHLTGKEIAGAKIVLYLKNVTSKTINNIMISEELPNIFSYVDEIIPGSIRPSEVRVFKTGSRIVWKLESLSPEEERIITFSVRSKLRVLGSVKISGTEIKYIKKGKQKVSYANATVLKN